MPKKKTGARKKAEKQKERQRGIRASRERPITEYFCNVIMVSLWSHHVALDSHYVLPFDFANLIVFVIN